MDDLVRWLGEQLDEDERRLRAAANEACGEGWQYDGRYVRALPEGDMVAVGSQDLMEVGVGEHIAAHDPARVLREIDAKRQAARLYTEAVEGRAAVRAKMCALMDDDCGEFERLHRQESELIEAEVRLRFVVLWLAHPYADRPGYREEWRP